MSQIAVISGTNRLQSNSEGIAKLYVNILKDLGTEAELVNLADLPKDFVFSALYENTGKNAAFNALRDRVNACSKVVFIVAEYNGSFPGTLKAFIDGLDYPGSFKNKKAALLGISSGDQGGALAMSHLSDILSYLGTHVMAQRIRLGGLDQHMHEGELNNKDIEQRIRKQAEALIEF
jgi:NAD(P)H-dependent FMN reductase